MTSDLGQSMDVGAQTTPTLYDLDGDGLLDLIIGERNGNFNHYQNVGSSSAPLFQLVTTQLGNITTDINFSTIGYSTPKLFTVDGVTQMISGMDEGTLFHINNIDGNLDGTWTVADSIAFDIEQGRRSSPSIADLDADGLLDIVVGNLSGGVALYLGSEEVIDLQENEELRKNLLLYPNPAQDKLNVSYRGEHPIEYIRIVDLSGRLVVRLSQTSDQIDISRLNSGTYIAEVRINGLRISKRFIKN